jgi:Fe-S-cluster-containing dehydrogenase component/CRP-like cAMP-binding protein
MATMMLRPQRWDQPFGAEMTDADVERLLSFPEISAIEKKKFPKRIPLEGILKNDARIVKYEADDIILREGDYGNSAFLVLRGKVRVVLAPGLPSEMLGRRKIKRKTFWQALSQLWSNPKVPEKRDINQYSTENLHQDNKGMASSHVFLQDVPAVLDSNKTAVLEQGQYFGELAALGRTPRTATIFAESDAELLEIRWQGLREFMKYDRGWRRKIDQNYRDNALISHLRATSIFSHLKDEDLQTIADETLFETYGEFDWHTTYKKLQDKDTLAAVQKEPIIARQGDCPDGILMVRTGFARISINRGNGRQTLTYLGAGDFYGADETFRAWKGEANVGMKMTISGLGYVEILRVPTKSVEKHVFPTWKTKQDSVRGKQTKPAKNIRRTADLVDQTLEDSALLEWALQERFVNGTQSMLINMDRCVRCDDCVKACAATHDGNPRFIRHGKTFQNWMIANACMHCADPVCMIGCPTGAIHRSLSGGMVIINDNTCIGCQTCANACPYSNIRMTGIRDDEGQLILDPEKQNPILKATKCDLCSDQITGPACVYACPHDAIKRVDFRQLVRDGISQL